MTSQQPRFASGGRGNFDLVVAAFVGLLLISNIGATKLIQFGPIITDGGAFLFPLTYVLGDVLAEVYGLRRANRAILTGFVLAALMSVTFLLVSVAPPADGWPNQDAWAAVLGFVPRLWVRLLGSTVVGEFADTLVFCSLAFGLPGAFLGGPSLDWPSLANYTIVGWVYKVLVETVCLPITYRVIAWIKRHEPDYEPRGADRPVSSAAPRT